MRCPTPPLATLLLIALLAAPACSVDRAPGRAGGGDGEEGEGEGEEGEGEEGEGEVGEGDGTRSARADLAVNVTPLPPEAGCGCGVGAGSPAALLPRTLLGGLLIALRPRR